MSLKTAQRASGVRFSEVFSGGNRFFGREYIASCRQALQRHAESAAIVRIHLSIHDAMETSTTCPSSPVCAQISIAEVV